MSVHAMPNLDIEKFRKVYALVSGGATDGEKASAKARATAMAKACGLTFAQAVSKLDAPKPQPKNIFEDLFNSPEMRAQRSERERKDEIKRKAVITRYGSLKALFDPMPWEQELRTAVEPFSLLKPYSCPAGIQRMYTASLDGEACGDCMEGTPRAKQVISRAVLMPATIGQALEELKVWNQLRWDRSLFVKYGWNENAEVEVRTRMIEGFLKTEPVQNWQDMENRFAWAKYDFENEYLDPVEREDPFMDRIEGDFEILRKIFEEQQVQSPPVQTGRRTNADKRNAVLSMLDTNPELSDREISRRVGVSPQTVANWRNRTAHNGQTNNAGRRNA